MSTIKSFDDALDFFPCQSTARLLSRFGTALRIYWSALCEGLAGSPGRTTN